MLSSDEKSAYAATAYILTFQHVNICFFGLENFIAALLHSVFLASVLVTVGILCMDERNCWIQNTI